MALTHKPAADILALAVDHSHGPAVSIPAATIDAEVVGRHQDTQPIARGLGAK